jgi:hypothetical protein
MRDALAYMHLSPSTRKRVRDGWIGTRLEARRALARA